MNTPSMVLRKSTDEDMTCAEGGASIPNRVLAPGGMGNEAMMDYAGQGACVCKLMMRADREGEAIKASPSPQNHTSHPREFLEPNGPYRPTHTGGTFHFDFKLASSRLPKYLL